MNYFPNKDKQNKYRRKYKFMKKVIKSLVTENAALCDEVAKVQESILIVKDERKFLLRKVLEHEHDSDLTYFSKGPVNTHSQNGTSSRIKK